MATNEKMTTNEKEDIYNVHGYIKADMIVLHSEMYDHEDNDGHNVFVPKLFVVNPKQISSLEEIKLNKNLQIKTQVKTKIYFANKEYQGVYESIDEILDLMSQQLEIQEHFKK